ncbi:MAG: hypothetical protein LBK06_05595 [Planctomycetaceae bacterium]|nr:hypothetical protein [Planctomycetaceae bacterium]
MLVALLLRRQRFCVMLVKRLVLRCWRVLRKNMFDDVLLEPCTIGLLCL